MSVQPSAASPDVGKHYYSEGLRWETAVYRSAVGSRNIWRLISVLLCMALILALATLYALLPLKSLEVVTLLVDKTTGFVEVARPLEAGGELTQRESVTRANIVRFVRARETYDPKGLRDNFDMASLYSAGVAAKDLQAEFAASNPASPMKKWGPETTVSVFVKSVIFLNERTAAIRFQTTRKSERETIATDWVARPLEAGGELTQRESVTRANIVRFVRARETYDPKGLRDNFDMASLYSAGVAAKDLQAEFAASNPASPMKKWGPETTISVFVKSVIFLNERTAAIRFQTTRKSERETIATDWVANVRFRYTSEPMRNDWRFDNPLGFQALEYRRDQETIGARTETAP